LDYLQKKKIKAALDGRKVNHSARKTTVTSLLHSNIEATTVMQLTGHKNVASINEYNTDRSLSWLDTGT
jgi:integrase